VERHADHDLRRPVRSTTRYFSGRGAGFKMNQTPGYFSTIGLPLVRGRDLRDTDTAAAQPVIVINQRLADQYFSGSIRSGGPSASNGSFRASRQLGPSVAWQIVGIVTNERTWTPEAPAAPACTPRWISPPVPGPSHRPHDRRCHADRQGRQGGHPRSRCQPDGLGASYAAGHQG